MMSFQICLNQVSAEEVKTLINIAVSIEYLFDNTASSIGPLLQRVLGKISKFYGPAITTDKMVACKQVLIELLTNGIKHSGCDSSRISLFLSTLFISITKTDTGCSFTPPALSEAVKVNDSMVICQTDYERLIAVRKSPQCIHFELIENSCTEPDPATLLMDHYGFLIISRAARSFIYQHDIKWGINTFAVKIDLYDNVVLPSSC